MKLFISLFLLGTLFVGQAEARQHRVEEEYPVCMIEATFLDGTKMLLSVECDGPFAVEGKCLQETKAEKAEESSWEMVDCKI